MGIAAMIELSREFARAFPKSQDHKPHVTKITIRWLLKELGWVEDRDCSLPTELSHFASTVVGEAPYDVRFSTASVPLHGSTRPANEFVAIGYKHC